VVNGFPNSTLQRYVDPYNSHIGSIVGFPLFVTPPGDYYLPCEEDSNAIVQTDARYSVLKDMLNGVNHVFMPYLAFDNPDPNPDIYFYALNGNKDVNPSPIIPLNVLFYDTLFNSYKVVFFPGSGPPNGYLLADSDSNRIVYYKFPSSPYPSNIIVKGQVPTIPITNQTKYYIRAK